MIMEKKETLLRKTKESINKHHCETKAETRDSETNIENL